MRCVKPDGKLVYATCSLLPEENEAQVEAFLKAHPEYERQGISIPVSMEDAPDSVRGIAGDYLRLTPHRNKTDGFFAAVMVRKS